MILLVVAMPLLLVIVYFIGYEKGFEDHREIFEKWHEPIED